MTSSKSLGALQAAALDALWNSEQWLSVRDVRARLGRRRPPAYTTILTVMTRLHDQGVLVREKRGRAFFYTPRVSREQWLGERAARELASGVGPPNQAVLVAFLDSAEQADPALLDRLSDLISERRRGRPQ